jgi:hypothetical protein
MFSPEVEQEIRQLSIVTAAWCDTESVMEEYLETLPWPPIVHIRLIAILANTCHDEPPAPTCRYIPPTASPT